MNNLAERIRQKLKEEELPGAEAHAEMESKVRRSEVRFRKREQTRICSVLILLYPEDKNTFTFPVILRPPYKGIHSHGNQIGLPGGGREAEDKDLIETALRETYEEIGVSIPDSNVIGSLTDLYIPPSDSLVTPIIAFSENKPKFTLDPKEVAELIKVPLRELAKTENRKVKTDTFGTDIEWEVPYFDINNKHIWGATAMMLNEFLKVVG